MTKDNRCKTTATYLHMLKCHSNCVLATLVYISMQLVTSLNKVYRGIKLLNVFSKLFNKVLNYQLLY